MPFHPRRYIVIGCLIAAVALGVVLLNFYPGQRGNLLYYFYLPVAAAGVILGRKIGVSLAALAAASVMSTGARGISFLFPGESPIAEKIGALVAWAIFLLAVAWLVGLVAQRGGNLELAQGFGANAISTIELERRRMAQDLHDGVTQYAARALLESQILEAMSTQAETDIRDQAERVKQSLDRLVTEARTMVWNLRPPLLGSEEFDKTYRSLVDDFRSRTGLETVLDFDGDFSVHSDSMRICVYRSTQEALANIERHAGASVVHVWARSDKSGVALIVRDNGKGFQFRDGLDFEGHLGLRGIKERVTYLGGQLHVHTAPGEGTSVLVSVPSYRGESLVRGKLPRRSQVVELHPSGGR